MGVRVVGTISRPSAGSNADTVQPRLDVAAFPYSAAGLLSFELNCSVFAVRIIGPVQGEAVPNKPFPEISAANLAGRYRPSVAIQADG
jgi:hypothetical protein